MRDASGGPIEPGHLVQTLFELADQAADHLPLMLAPQFDFPKLVHPQDRIAVHARFVQLREIDLSFIDQIKQRFAG